MSARSRISPNQLQRLSERLSETDWAVLVDLERVRMATASQLRRLHWWKPGSARSARRRLAWMTEQRLLSRLGRRVGGVRSGSDGFIYLLDVAGQRLLGARTARKPHEPGWAHIQHRLAITELYVRCRESEREDEIALLEFQAEPDSWRRYGRGTLKPDASLVLADSTFEHYAFIEVDCATEAASTVTAKARTYERYYQTGLEQQRAGLFPQIVWVVPHERRQQQLIDILSARPADIWRLHRVMQMEHAPLALIE